MALGWIATLAMLAVSSSAMAETKCSNIRKVQGDTEISVSISQFDDAPTTEAMTLMTRTPDKAFGAIVQYSASGGLVESPQKLMFFVQVPLPDAETGPAERIAWSLDDGPWANSETPKTPHRAKVPGQLYGVLFHGVASRRDLTHPELLGALSGGPRIAVRRLGAEGEVLGSSAFDYPDQATVTKFYALARPEALAALKPCGAPPVISGSPPPRPPRP